MIMEVSYGLYALGVLCVVGCISYILYIIIMVFCDSLDRRAEAQRDRRQFYIICEKVYEIEKKINKLVSKNKEVK